MKTTSQNSSKTDTGNRKPRSVAELLLQIAANLAWNAC